MTHRDANTKTRDLRWGLNWGLGMAFCFSLMALLAKPEEPPLRVLLAFYLFSGLVTGLLLALFRQRLRSRRVASLVGFLIALFAYGSIALVELGPPWEWGIYGWLGVLGVSSVVGLLTANVIWYFRITRRK